MLPFIVTLDTGTPVYEQVVFAAKKAIVSGLLRPGDRFPSVRQMSQELKINPNTAQKATAALVEEGLLEIRRGIETVVCERAPLASDARQQWLDETSLHLAIEAKTRLVGLDEVCRSLSRAWEKLDNGITP